MRPVERVEAESQNESGEGLKRSPSCICLQPEPVQTAAQPKNFLKGVDYQIIDAEEHPELAEKFGIMQAPTLVLVRDGMVQKFANASNIRRFAEEVKA